MDKVDFKKTLKHLYNPPKKDFVIIEVPKMNFLMIDGQGDPNTSLAYQQALETLYPMAFGIKFASKKSLGRDYTVPPLEGLWWAEDMDVFTTSTSKDAWLWTMMIMVPEWIDQALVEATRESVADSKDVPVIDRLRFEAYDEGLSVQIMHVGLFDDEAPTIHRLHNEFLPLENLMENGKHHEIYLSDPRRVAPEKLRTVLRQPVKPIAN
jgi:hypothetical protein